MGTIVAVHGMGGSPFSGGEFGGKSGELRGHEGIRTLEITVTY
jgi:hypothetical protein